MIVVIADDLSGAAELGGAATRRGLTAEVQTRFTRGADTDVVCVDTGTRALPASEAAAVVRQVAREVVTSNPDWIYFKFDSVLRGNVLVELRSAMTETGQPRALLVTANPSRGRVIRRGKYLIDGIPLHETAFAVDPDHPRRTASVVELLQGDMSGVSSPDVESSADLARLAADADPGTLLAGSVEFFEALLAQRTAVASGGIPDGADLVVSPASSSDHTPRTLLTCGSAASWEIRCRQARERRVQIFALFDDVSAIVRALEQDGMALMGIGNSEAVHSVTPHALTTMLAENVAEVIVSVPLDRLLLEGGATAAAVVRQLEWTRLVSIAGGGSGVGALRPVDTREPTLFIKPGSYPWPEHLW